MTNELPGMQDKSDLTGDQTDCDMAAQEKMREEFETEVLKAEGHIGKLPCKTYSDPITASAWWAWQASAAQSAETIARLEADNAAIQNVADDRFQIMQLEAKRLAESQANRERLEANIAHLKQIIHVEQLRCDRANERSARTQHNNETLRDALEMVQPYFEGEHHPDHPVCKAIREALAQPLDTSALDAYVAKYVPTGYKVVPINMTDEMFEAYDQATKYGSIEDGWKAMLDAAPLPPASDKQGE